MSPCTLAWCSCSHSRALSWLCSTTADSIPPKLAGSECPCKASMSCGYRPRVHEAGFCMSRAQKDYTDAATTSTCPRTVTASAPLPSLQVEVFGCKNNRERQCMPQTQMGHNSYSCDECASNVPAAAPGTHHDDSQARKASHMQHWLATKSSQSPSLACCCGSACAAAGRPWFSAVVRAGNPCLPRVCWCCWLSCGGTVWNRCAQVRTDNTRLRWRLLLLRTVH